ncbi:MAG: SRPBCC domain-containing protein [Chitinophagaceae bacterium]|jgi:uncharacterized protein YndB with AHSA1/START domain|nr:SRPBCC domain-containing protein [Chitinophagaceae bacterium]
MEIQTSADPIVKVVVLNAPVDQVWKAITDKNEMKNWYFDLPEFEPKVGAKFQFYGENEGRRFLHLCEVKEVVEYEKISYTWMYEGQNIETLVSFELFPEGAQTRVKLTHTGLEKLPQDRDFAKSNFDKGWTEIIQKSLKEYAEK